MITNLPEEKISLRNFSPRLELALTWAGIVFTLFATLMVGSHMVQLLWLDIANGDTGDFALHVLLSLIVASLIYGGLVYQFARIQYVKRLRDHAPASREALEALHVDPFPSGGSITHMVGTFCHDCGSFGIHEAR